MQTEKQIDQLLALRAAEWMETLKAGDRRDHLAFAEWLRDSKRHVEGYLEMEALDREIQALDATDRPDIEAIVRSITGPNVLQLQGRPGAIGYRTRNHGRLWPLAAAIAGITLIGALAVLGYRSFIASPGRVATAVGEQRMLTLPDGSQIRMNVDTDLKIHYSAHERSINLASGEALFQVMRDPARPFVVHTPTADVRAVGTQFNVYQRHATVVSVLEGRVQVMTQVARIDGLSKAQSAIQSLGAGQEAQVANGRIEMRAHPDVVKTAAWREGRVYFDEMPLEEIAREFNRHGGPVRMTVEGVLPGVYRFGGTFKASDPGSFADVLERQGDLVVERRVGEILIRPRMAGDGGGGIN